ncbi:MAG: DUF2586 family protein [Firmicutes bacterium]|nr:DUF2586 family protein [Bacillota bacterium]
MLPDARIVVADGGLGLLAPDASGLHFKVGVCSRGEVNQIIPISDRDQIVAKLGTGPLVDALFDAIGTGASLIYAVRAVGDIAGAVGPVTATKAGTGNVTAAGAPLDAYDVIIEVLSSGSLNVATFRYSLDGGDTYSKEITVPAGGSYPIDGTGLTLSFTADNTNPGNSFLAGDRYAFKATAPKASVASVNGAIDAIMASNTPFEFIHVVGESDAAMWAAMDTRAKDAETSFRYIHFLMEARGPNAGESVDQWVTALQTAAQTFASTRVSVVAGRAEISDANTGRVVDRNVAGLYSGRIAAIKVSRSPGRVKDGPIPGVVALNPAGINEGHITMLDEARYVTFRQYQGLPGFFVTNGRMMADSTSDFRYVELRRTMDKACREVRLAALGFVQDEGTEAGLSDMEKRLSEPLDAMVGAGEIAAGRVVIPRDQQIIAGAKLRTKVRIVPIGIMRAIEVEIGFELPAATPAAAPTANPSAEGGVGNAH